MGPAAQQARQNHGGGSLNAARCLVSHEARWTTRKQGHHGTTQKARGRSTRRHEITATVADPQHLPRASTGQASGPQARQFCVPGDTLACPDRRREGAAGAWWVEARELLGPPVIIQPRSSVPRPRKPGAGAYLLLTQLIAYTPGSRHYNQTSINLRLHT